MDEHARRVTAPVVDALDGFDRGAVSVADLQAIVAAAADALDNSNANLVEVLNLLAEDLEEVRFAIPPNLQPGAVQARSLAVRELLTPEV